MKIAVFSDIYGNLPALQEIINDIDNRKNIDKIICLGDAIGLGPNPKECLDLIMDHNIEMILGNHELYSLYNPYIDVNMNDDEAKHHEWIKSNLSTKEINFLQKCKLQLVYNNILFEHFILDDKLQYPFNNLKILKDGDINTILHTLPFNYIFIGHEHNAFEIDSKLVDIGSSGCIKNNITSYYIININDNITYEKINLEYDRIYFEKLLNEKDYPEKIIIAKIFFGI